MDWRKQGADTAMKGLTIPQGQAYFTRECKDVPINNEQFSAGYSETLPAFCNPENIHLFSAKGGHYAETCPETLVTPKFLTKYQTGREIFLERKIAALESEVADARAAQGRAESRASTAESRASSLEDQVSSCQAGR